jgi:hypothetical protein
METRRVSEEHRAISNGFEKKGAAPRRAMAA